MFSLSHVWINILCAIICSYFARMIIKSFRSGTLTFKIVTYSLREAWGDIQRGNWRRQEQAFFRSHNELTNESRVFVEISQKPSSFLFQFPSLNIASAWFKSSGFVKQILHTLCIQKSHDKNFDKQIWEYPVPKNRTWCLIY